MKYSSKGLLPTKKECHQIIIWSSSNHNMIDWWFINVKDKCEEKNRFVIGNQWQISVSVPVGQKWHSILTHPYLSHALKPPHHWFVILPKPSSAHSFTQYLGISLLLLPPPSECITFFSNLFSSILSMCLNYLGDLLSTPSSTSLTIPDPIYT